MLSKHETIQLQITKDTLAVFLACLGIGTLHAIRIGALPAKAGIWTIGKPSVWEPIMGDPAIPQEIIDVFQTCDELSAIQKLLPDEFDTKVAKLIDRLQAELAKIQDPGWEIEWLLETDDSGR